MATQAEVDSFHKSAFPNANEMRKFLTKEPESWDLVWKNNLTPWEAGAAFDVQPPLKQLIESGEVPFPKNGKALVPGCGRGYDTIYLASALGWNTVIGSDVSATAVEAANEFLKSKSIPPSVVEKVKFEKSDFFQYVVPDEEKFDVIYDYTFYVAIPPSLRPAWGAKMQELVKPGGHLITLMFPHVPEPYQLGPPFWSSFENYIEVLGGSNGSGGAKGWEIVYNKIPPPETQSDVHKGKDRMVVWKRL
ncbi:S-adenosyl-L-methionine-dependent methyltransferase [Gymnopus androsaceus JB14]|uniref:S-adenosyl-L-methionine-dependent methyltransferase n=1 Tax=Gymnopus androsaceus JB14 TaxID=1447944 RepID=A0A6A4HLK9_9AGAR|nr:S-adenosyl-L-methionine-dependent methyltransferase [Gymnopus androsaceus JB14]